MLGLARTLRVLGCRRPGARPVRRPAARRGRDAARRERAHRVERLVRPAGPRPRGAAPHDPGAARRGVRRAPRARAAGARPHHDHPAVPQRADGGHVPPGGRQRGLRHRQAGGAVAGQAARHPLRGVEGRQGHGRAGPRRHATSCCSTASRSSGSPRRPRPRRPGRPSSSSGRHEERKGLAVLLDALRHLPPDVVVWVGGTGPADRGAARPARRRPPHRVARAGSATTRWRPACGAPTCSARPSLHGESFGVVLLEAMAAGAVVVASALDGYANVATHDVDALMPPPGDSDALAAALRAALGDGGLRRPPGRGGRAARPGVLDGAPGRGLRRALRAPRPTA